METLEEHLAHAEMMLLLADSPEQVAYWEAELCRLEAMIHEGN